MENNWASGSFQTIQLLKAKRYDNCVYAIRAIGHSKSVLVCTNKAGSAGQLHLAEPTDLCRNFQPKNKIPCRPEIKQPKDSQIRFIPLTKGKVAIVDAQDYDWLSKYKWHAVKCDSRFYAYRSKNRRSVSMHREIMHAPKGMVVDHIDGNSLNNRRSNLRLCTVSQNHQNRRRTYGSSKYKGTWWDKRRNKWVSAITFNGKYIHIGCFDNETDAAKAYDRKAAELFGEFAYLNFPDCATEDTENSETKLATN